MQNPYFQQNNAPYPQNAMMGGINPAQHILASLQMLGLTTAQFALEAERLGIGNAATIQQALEMGDARPLHAYAMEAAKRNPQLAQQAGMYHGQMYGGVAQPRW